MSKNKYYNNFYHFFSSFFLGVGQFVIYQTHNQHVVDTLTMEDTSVFHEGDFEKGGFLAICQKILKINPRLLSLSTSDSDAFIH